MPATASEEALGTGRRKTSVARVRITAGKGKITINDRELEDFFKIEQDRNAVTAPLDHAEVRNSVDVTIRVHGGGTTGQAGALRLAIARALIVNEPDDRPALKKAGFLTRDARVKESKKYGLKKARKAPQYSKR